MKFGVSYNTAVATARAGGWRSDATAMAASIDRVPRISAFYGIVITMYWRDHPPPHFHATYAGHVAEIEIGSGDVLDGWLPPRALRLVAEWSDLHRDELAGNWDRARAHEQLVAIDPLP